MYHTRLERIRAGIGVVLASELRLGVPLFGHYWLPFPASDPFASPWLFEICQELWHARTLPGYLLTLGWNRKRGAETAAQFVLEPESLLRIMFTISNFSELARTRPRLQSERVAASLRDIRQLWDRTATDGRPLVQISPQYAKDRPPHDPLSHESTSSLLDRVCASAGIDRQSWERDDRIHWRPITGLGRARSDLGIKSEEVLYIVPERPAPTISASRSRPWSGLITTRGEVAAYLGERGLLGRARQQWSPIAPLPDQARLPAMTMA